MDGASRLRNAVYHLASALRTSPPSVWKSLKRSMQPTDMTLSETVDDIIAKRATHGQG